MNFYPFHIGDFKSHTDHLSPIEDLAYRRLLDYYYLHEKPLPDDAEFLSKRIRLDDIQAIQYVLSEFFTLKAEHWHNSRADTEIAKYQARSIKARKSANKRWQCDGNANAMRTHSEGNATNTITNTKTKTKVFKKPKPDEVEEYAKYLGFTLDGSYFCDYYEARGWQLAQGPMKDWKAAVRTWKRNHNKNEEFKPRELIL
jgi:uncharacterized protein YdaU (DUF1376 family)